MMKMLLMKQLEEVLQGYNMKTLLLILMTMIAVGCCKPVVVEKTKPTQTKQVELEGIPVVKGYLGGYKIKK